MSRRKASIKNKGVDILFGNGLPPVEGPRPRRQVEAEWAGGLSAEAEAAVAESEPVGLGGGGEAETPSPLAPVRSSSQPAEAQSASVLRVKREEEEAVPSADLRREGTGQAATNQGDSDRQDRLSEEQDRLFSEINNLYSRVERDLSPSAMAQKAEGALKRLRKARDILTKEDSSKFDEAEYEISQVRLLLDRTKQSHEQASRYGMKLFLYEAIWFLLLIAGIIFHSPLAAGLVTVTGMEPTDVENLLVSLITTMMWGGIGGVLGALYSLRWHISQLHDFDQEYNIWYLANPLLGLVLGGIVYMIFSAGFMAMMGITGPTGASAPEAANWLPSVVACLVGFREKFALELLDRLIQVIARGPEEEEE